MRAGRDRRRQPLRAPSSVQASAQGSAPTRPDRYCPSPGISLELAGRAAADASGAHDGPVDLVGGPGLRGCVPPPLARAEPAEPHRQRLGRAPAGGIRFDGPGQHVPADLAGPSGSKAPTPDLRGHDRVGFLLRSVCRSLGGSTHPRPVAIAGHRLVRGVRPLLGARTTPQPNPRAVPGSSISSHQLTARDPGAHLPITHGSRHGRKWTVPGPKTKNHQ